MRRDLLDRARADLKFAGEFIQSDDEYELQLCAYHVQQAAEKILKQLYIEQGVDFRKTHDLASLLSGLPNWEEYMDEETYIRFCEKSALLTEWENKTRYAEGYLIARKFVLVNFQFVLNLFEHIVNVLEQVDMANAVGGVKPCMDSTSINRIEFQ